MNSKKPHNPSLQRKHAARLAAVQCIYSMLINPAATPQSLIDWQLEERDEDDKLLPLMPEKKLLQGVVTGVAETHTALQEHLLELLSEEWSGKRMPKLMRALLMCATYEYVYSPSLHGRIIVDQYVGVADAFLDESDVRFINGVLHQLTRHFRPDDVSPPREPVAATSSDDAVEQVGEAVNIPESATAKAPPSEALLASVAKLKSTFIKQPVSEASTPNDALDESPDVSAD